MGNKPMTPTEEFVAAIYPADVATMDKPMGEAVDEIIGGTLAEAEWTTYSKTWARAERYGLHPETILLSHLEKHPEEISEREIPMAIRALEAEIKIKQPR